MVIGRSIRCQEGSLAQANDRLSELHVQFVHQIEEFKASIEKERKVIERADKAKEEVSRLLTQLKESVVEVAAAKAEVEFLKERIRIDLFMMKRDIEPTREAAMAADCLPLDPAEIASSPNDMTEGSDLGEAKVQLESTDAFTEEWLKSFRDKCMLVLAQSGLLGSP
ncbi:hypothetical protein HAX54_044287 [Datura stramonium]|uniref:Uncharacterized protein n=1 Tax=Datura stramonium TaxID=4076 RepID=A0ABS8W6W0_DATST|nr:hypothetical protein [Datura stramonium]